jgi:hypothetical protein
MHNLKKSIRNTKNPSTFIKMANKSKHNLRNLNDVVLKKDKS